MFSAAVIIDVSDFTTWTPDTWALLDWDSIAFPSDAAINICTARCYMAVAMIMLYQTELRERHKCVWDELIYAWLAMFSCDLHTVGVERWPETGQFAFTPDQSNWLTNTLWILHLLLNWGIAFIYYLYYFNFCNY